VSVYACVRMCAHMYVHISLHCSLFAGAETQQAYLHLLEPDLLFKVDEGRVSV
jgi:hypothetical protein